MCTVKGALSHFFNVAGHPSAINNNYCPHTFPPKFNFDFVDWVTVFQLGVYELSIV